MKHQILKRDNAILTIKTSGYLLILIDIELEANDGSYRMVDDVF